MSMDQMRDFINTLVKPLRNRVYNMITRAIIESVKDSEGIQLLKINLLKNHSRSDIERFQNFGFSSNPPKSSECVALSIGGNTDHIIVIVADDRNSRIKGLAEGESVQYNKNGDKWHLKKDGTLEGTLSKDLVVTLQKLKFQNGTGELIDLLVQILDALLVEPFIVNKIVFAAIKTKMETFKL